MLMFMCEYLRRIFSVSSSVLNEFMSTSGTFAAYVLFKCWKRNRNQRDSNKQNRLRRFLLVVHWLLATIMNSVIKAAKVRIKKWGSMWSTHEVRSYFDLLDGEVEERELVANWDERLRPRAPHRRAQASVQLEYDQFVEHATNDIRWKTVLQRIVRNDLKQRRQSWMQVEFRDLQNSLRCTPCTTRHFTRT